MPEPREISDVALIRVLGEYTAKAQSAYQRYSLNRSLWVAATVALWAFAASVTLIITDFGALKFLVALPAALVILVMFSYIIKQKTTVEIGVWQLRHVYELVSRREDLGVDLDSGARLEMELRLSEAAFLLTDLSGFDKPEKFRQFQRVGRVNVLFVDDDSFLAKPRASQSDGPAPQSTPPAPPGSIASPS